MSDATYHVNRKKYSMYEIEFYDTEDGTCPVKEFINGLEPKMKAKALRTIDLLEVNGPALRSPHSSAMGNGIFELRIKQSSNIARVFYFFYVGEKIILTNGFVKKSQKTPRTELELARKYKEDYMQRRPAYE